MKKNIKNISILIVIIYGLILFNTSVIAYSEPTINIEPQEPEQMSKITFSIIFDDYNDIQDVFLLYNECTKNDICFTRENKSMLNLGEGKFEIDVNLEHDNSDYIQYWLEFKTDQGWQAFPLEPPYPKTYLKEKQNNNDTPGFELIGIIISIIFISYFIYTRKR